MLDSPLGRFPETRTGEAEWCAGTARALPDDHTDRQTDRETDGPTNIQTDGQTDGPTNIQTNGQTDRQTDRHRVHRHRTGKTVTYAHPTLAGVTSNTIDSTLL